MPWNIQQELDALGDQHLRRRLRITDPARPLVNFASNDYLGLAESDELKAALQEGVARYGAGSGASRLVTGTLQPHHDLEEQIAAFKSTEASLTFSSGYAAAFGAITSLVGAQDTIILDKLAHASLIDASRLSGATVRIFPHNHLGKLEKLLQTTAATTRRTLVITESVFSMDGDTALLPEIVELKNRFGAWLMVDEAHAVGVLGPEGRGLAAALGLAGEVEVQMGTLSKAVGLSGGYIAGSRTLVDLMINRARSFIYTTAPPPALCHAASASLTLINSQKGDDLRKALGQNIGTLRSALDQATDGMYSAIHPFIVGNEESALQTAERLQEEGFLAPAIRYPTVPRGSARIRVTLSAQHRKEDILRLASVLRA